MHSDKEIWDDFVAGNGESFAALYSRYADELYAFGLRYTSDTATIEDSIHDMFVDLHKYRPSLSDVASPRFYLLKSFRRKLARSLSSPAFIRIDLGFAGVNQLVFEMPEPSVEHRMVMDETASQTSRLLTRELNLLPSRQREIIYLRYKYDLSYEEIASLLEISVPTCRTLVYRAINRLRSRIASPGIVSGLLLLAAFHRFN